MKKFHKLLMGTSAISMALVAAPTATFAQDGDDNVEEVVVTGSRRPARSAGDTPAPVDVISGDQFNNQAGGDMSDLLRNVVPSYNVNAQPINDAATFIRPANLRGLAPDQTLVLVNGKRRHRAAVITFLGSGISDGAQGADISAIPSIALKQVEVLRDGAAAQYGSDAIAGVINFGLNNSSEGGSIVAKYGSTYRGDGESLQISGNIGMPLGDNGFLNLSGEWRDVNATSRSKQRVDANNLRQSDAFRDPAQIWGQPEISDDFKLFVNMGAEISENAEFYAFGNYSERTVLGGFYYRNPDTRGGVYSDGEHRLVGDLTGDMSGNCPTNVRASNTAAYDDILADPNCFIFNEMFPGGFTPNFGGTLKDKSVTAGVKGQAGGWNYDVSGSYGNNNIAFRIINTVNASLGPNTPTEFSPGVYDQTETGLNLDMSKGFDVGLASDLNFAFGVEWRKEEFEVEAGDEASWARGPLFDQGFSSGSNGFNGFSPEQAGQWDRTSKAIYVDLEADVTDELVLGAALRWEDFSSFGTTVNGKLSALYRVSDTFKIRSTASTGFRAPSPGQANISNVSTTISVTPTGNELIDEGLIPSTHPIAVALGEENNVPSGELGEEKSTSFSLGFVWEMDAASLTVDMFSIKVKDRISIGDQIDIDAAKALELELAGIAGAANFRGVSWFQNAFDTRTQGVDVVLNMPLTLTDSGNSNFTLSGNYTDTKVTEARGNVAGSDREFLLENALPNIRLNATITHSEADWRFLARASYHGAYSELFAGGDLHNLGGEINFDIEGAYSVTENLEVVLGAENIFNNKPDRLSAGSIGWSGARFPESAPFGFNGGTYYAKVKFTF